MTRIPAMTVEDRVFNAFKFALNVNDSVDRSALIYRKFQAWSSFEHMTLVATLEDEFDCTLDTDDILAMSSYAKAVEIMSRHAKA
jgi:acyl carrier protein